MAGQEKRAQSERREQRNTKKKKKKWTKAADDGFFGQTLRPGLGPAESGSLSQKRLPEGLVSLGVGPVVVPTVMGGGRRGLLGGGSNLAATTLCQKFSLLFAFVAVACAAISPKLRRRWRGRVEVEEVNGQMDEQIIPQIPRGNYKCPSTSVLGPSVGRQSFVYHNEWQADIWT